METRYAQNGDWVEGEKFDWDGAVVVASSRSGNTANFRLKDGRLLSVCHLKSGVVISTVIAELDPSLTVRY